MGQIVIVAKPKRLTSSVQMLGRHLRMPASCNICNLQEEMSPENMSSSISLSIYEICRAY